MTGCKEGKDKDGKDADHCFSVFEQPEEALFVNSNAILSKLNLPNKIDFCSQHADKANEEFVPNQSIKDHNIHSV